MDKRTDPNRTRDHLANERTYLAWVRTAIALMGFGVVIVRLRYLQPPNAQGHSHGWQLGLLFDVAGLVMVLFASAHYFYVRRAIDSDEYQPTGGWILACSIVVALIGTGVLVYLFNAPAVGGGVPAVP